MINAPILNFRFKSKKIDVLLKPANIPDQYHSVGIEVGLYPIDKQLNSESFKVLPYEEYANDIADNIRSTYFLEEDNTSKIFGVLLSIFILVIFALFKPDDIYSIESIVAVIGAYTLGRELWTDLAKNFSTILQSIFRNLRFKTSTQYFSKISYSVISEFFDHARKERYGQIFSLADKFRFSTQSNSKIVDLVYTNKKILETNDEILICFFEFNKKLLERISQKDFLIVSKVTFLKKRFFYTRYVEMYQVIDRGEVGVFSKDKFYKNSILLQKPFTSGKFKFYREKKLVKEANLLKL